MFENREIKKGGKPERETREQERGGKAGRGQRD